MMRGQALQIFFPRTATALQTDKQTTTDATPHQVRPLIRSAKNWRQPYHPDRGNVNTGGRGHEDNPSHVKV